MKTKKTGFIKKVKDGIVSVIKGADDMVHPTVGTSLSIASREVEISIRSNELTEVSAVSLVAWCRDIRVLAMRSYCDREGVILLLVTTNPSKASRVLELAGFHCKANPVVLIGPLNRTGLTAPVGHELDGMGIDVLYSYASQVEIGRNYLVYRTTDDERAVRMIEDSVAVHNLVGIRSRPVQRLPVGVFDSQGGFDRGGDGSRGGDQDRPWLADSAERDVVGRVQEQPDIGAPLTGVR